MITFDGKRDPDRRYSAENGWQEILLPKSFKGNNVLWPKAYRKTTLTYAVQIPIEFKVDTLEGMHRGHAGDYLAIGPAGEMYPIAKDVFEASYEEA